LSSSPGFSAPSLGAKVSPSHMVYFLHRRVASVRKLPLSRRGGLRVRRWSWLVADPCTGNPESRTSPYSPRTPNEHRDRRAYVGVHHPYSCTCLLPIAIATLCSITPGAYNLLFEGGQQPRPALIISFPEATTIAYQNSLHFGASLHCLGLSFRKACELRG
jgi:hypothetical protein